MPLSTLRRKPRGTRRKTQGQDGFAFSFPVGLFHPLQHAGLSRRTLGQTRSSFDFRWMMDHRKIFLCDLAKGSIGDDNAKLLGSLIVLQEKLAALSRRDIAESERVPHGLYVEEAQSFIGDFESILAEARKFALMLTLVTQGIEALPHEAAFAVFTNCATIITFRVSGADALRLAGEFG